MTFYTEKRRIDPMLMSISESSDNSKNENSVSFSCDNANTMLGGHKGVILFLKEVQPSIIIQGCSCHLILLAAKKATTALAEINVEHFLVQLYYYLDKSSKEKKQTEVKIEAKLFVG